MNLYEGDYLNATLEVVGPKSGATAGHPVESVLEMFDDGHIMTGLWEVTPGEFPSEKKGISEFMVFLSGEGTIFDEDGTPHEIGSGVAMMFPDGWKGRWQVRKTVRKAYTIVVSPPP
jgi:uncharacterized cupin superfamily protein